VATIEKGKDSFLGGGGKRNDHKLFVTASRKKEEGEL